VDISGHVQPAVVREREPVSRGPRDLLRLVREGPLPADGVREEVGGAEAAVLELAPRALALALLLVAGERGEDAMRVGVRADAHPAALHLEGLVPGEELPIVGLLRERHV